MNSSLPVEVAVVKCILFMFKVINMKNIIFSKEFDLIDICNESFIGESFTINKFTQLIIELQSVQKKTHTLKFTLNKYLENEVYL